MRFEAIRSKILGLGRQIGQPATIEVHEPGTEIKLTDTITSYEALQDRYRDMSLVLKAMRILTFKDDFIKGENEEVQAGYILGDAGMQAYGITKEHAFAAASLNRKLWDRIKEERIPSFSPLGQPYEVWVTLGYVDQHMQRFVDDLDPKELGEELRILYENTINPARQRLHLLEVGNNFEVSEVLGSRRNGSEVSAWVEENERSSIEELLRTSVPSQVEYLLRFVKLLEPYFYTEGLIKTLPAQK